MFSLFKNLRKIDYFYLVLIVGLIVTQVWLDLLLPDYIKDITELVTAKTGTMGDVWIAGLKMLGCALGSMALAILTGFFVAIVAASQSKITREKLFAKIEGFSLESVHKFSTASLITRSTNDIVQVQTIVSFGLQALIKAPITAVWAITKILTKSWEWSVATGVAVGVIFLMVLVMVFVLLPSFKKIQGLTDDLNNAGRENLTGLKVVRAFNAEGYEEAKFDKVNSKLTKTHLLTSRVMSIMMPVMNIVMSGLTLSIYWIGAYLIEGASNILTKSGLMGDMVAFTSYAMQVVFAFIMLVMVFIMLPRALVSAKRISEVLNTKEKIENGTEELSNIVDTIKFNNVGFKYSDNGDEVLDSISFEIKRGETVAVIGGTGSGKTTLLNLILRFYDVSNGEILINGKNIKEYDVRSLREKVALVPQQAILFTGSIEDNITYSDLKDAGLENNLDAQLSDKISEAISISSSGFVYNLEEGLKTHVSQGGKNFSGGQKQRLAIGRAIFKSADVLVFDDSFSALDYKTDKEVRSSINNKLADKTKIIIAQRIGTIKDADKILVLDSGKLADIGTHRELLNKCEVYREIALSQLSKEELDMDIKPAKEPSKKGGKK